MANVLKRERQQAVLHLLAEGSSIRSAERLTGIHRDTICRLIVKFGDRCRTFLDSQMQGLSLTHLQLDEQWTYCGKKQRRLTVDEKQERYDAGDIYLWIAIDQHTKLIPTFALGKRSADNCRRFCMDLRSRLEFPLPHASDQHAYGHGGYRPIVQVSTDAFAAYREAIDMAFGAYARYGQLVKNYRNRDLPGNYAPAEMIAVERRPIRGIENPFTICTSHVERFNGTTRLFMKRFNRLTYCFSKKLENLAAACAMYVAYYDYCWRPRYSDTSGRAGQRRPTPAMAAKLTGHVWSFAELFAAVMPTRAAV